MEITLRLGRTSKIEVIDSYQYVPKRDVEIKITPVPPFLKGGKCKCGKKAKFMLGNLTFICSKCLSSMFADSNELKTMKDVSIPLTEGTLSMLRFEWSLNRERWYNLFGGNIKPRNVKKFLSNVKEMLVKNKTFILEVEYDKENKIMTIF